MSSDLPAFRHKLHLGTKTAKLVIFFLKALSPHKLNFSSYIDPCSLLFVYGSYSLDQYLEVTHQYALLFR